MAQKSAKKDYTADRLPHTRKEVFFDALKQNKRQFLNYGLVVFLFSLPMHLLAVYNDYLNVNLMNAYAWATGQEQALLYAKLISTNNLFAVLQIPCWLLLAVGIAGLLRVVRQHAWGENVFFAREFALGIRQNIRQVLLLALLTSLFQAAAAWCRNVGASEEELTMQIAMVMPTVVGVLLCIPVAAYAAISTAVYNNGFVRDLRLGFILAVRHPLKTAGALLCCAIPFALQLLPNFICHVVGRLAGSFLAPVVLLGWMLFVFNRFDAHINAHQFPELVGKGTYPAAE